MGNNGEGTVLRLSQFIWYMNEKEHPTYLDIRHRYNHIEITPELKKARRVFLAEKRKARIGAGTASRNSEL